MVQNFNVLRVLHRLQIHLGAVAANRRKIAPPIPTHPPPPPFIPAAKFRPVCPSTTTRPLVMYSQPWSPTPSTTAVAPELRTAKRSPAMPFRNASPVVAP